MVILFLILAAFITFSLASSNNYLDYYSQTKAVCNETNYCQDFQISCNEERAIMMAPITGAVIQLPENWTDSRNDLDKELC